MSGFRIPHNRPSLGSQEAAAAEQVISSGQIAGGWEVREFESDLADFLGLTSGGCVAVSSGSAALFLSLWALGAKDRTVALPSYGCASLRHAIRLVGGREELVDIREDSAEMKPSDSDIRIFPHLFGIPSPIADNATVGTVEDCAQALGARLDNRPVGIQTKVSVFSFYATKIITSGGQGGAVVSRDADLIDSIRDFLDFDMRNDSRSCFNFAMTEIQAAIGRVQLRRLPEFIDRREAIFSYYQNAGLPLMGSKTADSQVVRFRAIIETKFAAAVRHALHEVSVAAIVPIEESEILGDPNHYPNAQARARSTVSIPCYPSLRDDDAARISEIALRFLEAGQQA